MKAFKTLIIMLLGLTFLASCAHDSRSPSSAEEKEEVKKFYEVRSAKDFRD